jgi:hypothetical protein
MGNDPAYRQAARSLGEEMVRRRYGLVYGGGDVGLMGVLAKTVMRAGGTVTGVIPEILMDKELGLNDVTELIKVDSMHERKMTMASRADGFVAMPGGIGTLEELFEIITWGYLGLHRKPCGLLNVAGYYDTLIDFLQSVEQQGFMHQSINRYLISEKEPMVLLDRLESMVLPEVETIIEREEQT